VSPYRHDGVNLDLVRAATLRATIVEAVSHQSANRLALGIYPRRCFLLTMRAKALRAVSIAGKGSSCRRPGWPMRPYSRARENPPNRSGQISSGKTAPASSQARVSPTRRPRDEDMAAWLHAARLYGQRREGQGGKYPPKPSGLSTGLKIESRGCFQGEEPRPLCWVRPSTGSPALIRLRSRQPCGPSLPPKRCQGRRTAKRDNGFFGN
jgi:hypothetical protein